MKIAIIGAMQEEIEMLAAHLKLESSKHLKPFESYHGNHHQNSITLLKSGIGKVSAAIGTTLLIQHIQPDLIINIGSAAGLLSGAKIGDIAVSTSTLYHDADATAWGYQLGQIPKQPERFIADKQYTQLAENITFDHNIHHGQIISGDSFIGEQSRVEQLKQKFPKAIAVDMESTAIAQTCYQLHTHLIICRAISDTGNDDASEEHDNNLEYSSKQSARFALAILKQL